jgi:hypothetical protein
MTTTTTVMVTTLALAEEKGRKVKITSCRSGGRRRCPCR